MDGRAKGMTKQSLQLRLSLWLSLIILAMALVAGALSFVAAFDEAIELQDDQLRQIGALVGRRSLPGHDALAQQAGGDTDAQRRIVVQLLPPADGKAAAPRANWPTCRPRSAMACRPRRCMASAGGCW